MGRYEKEKRCCESIKVYDIKKINLFPVGDGRSSPSIFVD